MWAVQLLRRSLGRKYFELFTDHQALKWLLDLTDASNSLARLRLPQLEFDFTVRCKKSAKKQIADAVSRLPTLSPTEAEGDLEIPCFTIMGEVHPCLPTASPWSRSRASMPS